MKLFIPYSFTWYRSWFLFSMQNEFIKMKKNRKDIDLKLRERKDLN